MKYFEAPEGAFFIGYPNAEPQSSIVQHLDTRYYPRTQRMSGNAENTGVEPFAFALQNLIYPYNKQRRVHK
jgi:hypothetical protein